GPPVPGVPALGGPQSAATFGARESNTSAFKQTFLDTPPPLTKDIWTTTDLDIQPNSAPQIPCQFAAVCRRPSRFQDVHWSGCTQHRVDPKEQSRLVPLSGTYPCSPTARSAWVGWGPWKD